MDPPGSTYFCLLRYDDDEENYNHENDNDDCSLECEEEEAELDDIMEKSIANDNITMPSSLFAATQHYKVYLSNGGPAMTSKTSIDSTPVLVQTPTTTTKASNHPTVTSTTIFEASIPITVVAIPNDPPEISSPPQEQRLPEVTLTEQASPPEKAQKHMMMVERLVSGLGYPTGLAHRLVSCIQTRYVKHYWLVDNSGSMLTNDCMRMVQKDILDVGAANSKELYDTVKCSRWNELESALLSHVDLARILEVPTTFRLLNGQNGVQEFTINHVPNDIETAKSIIHNSQPGGVTLLSNHVMEICHRIEADKDMLLENGQKAVVVIATDAIPSDEYGESSTDVKEEFFNALKQLQLLPVWIVIRLCTSDRKVIQYYRKLDKKLEISIECVSDFINEKKEVRKWNPWLNYSQQIHQCREMGFHHRVFDLLDERALTKDDLYVFLTVLFGKETFDAKLSPNIFNDWKGFLRYLKTRVLNHSVKHYSPITKKMEDIIDVKRLRRAHRIPVYGFNR